MKLLTREEAPIGGRDPSESPAGFDRNAWPPSLGIHGRLRRNAHPGTQQVRPTTNTPGSGRPLSERWRSLCRAGCHLSRPLTAARVLQPAL